MDNTILINEISPRVHNSGHFTIEGCKTSQFTNHIRTIMGLSSGDCNLAHERTIVKMTNILGWRNEDVDREGNYYYHWYHKKPKNKNAITFEPLRKLGHYTEILDYDEYIENNKKFKNDEQINYWTMSANTT